MNTLVTLKNIKVSEMKLHLYLASGCPFCHRVFAALSVTQLTSRVSITWTQNIKGPGGWKFDPQDEPIFGLEDLGDLYKNLSPGYSEAYSVPLLVDINSEEILSTDSSEIVRFISTGFNGKYQPARDIAPKNLQEQIDSKNSWLHKEISRAVYLVGFATEQFDYESKRARFFEALDCLEQDLKGKSFLIANRLTESDLYLLATLERFDTIYFWLFKCNLNRLEDYSNLSTYLLRLRKIAGLAKTYNAKLTEEHYYLSTMHVRGEVRELNPTKTIPEYVLQSKLRQA